MNMSEETKYSKLFAEVKNKFSNHNVTMELNEITLELTSNELIASCETLKNDPVFKFDELIDLCGVDYSLFGKNEWETEASTCNGFSRGVNSDESNQPPVENFAVVYHLLSLTKNQRIRLKVFLKESDLIIKSVVGIWACADWFEREAFDLFGILFEGHEDLRRILTDYGFIGHPFRKDFPLTGHVEMRYDKDKQRVVYEPVNIEPRTLVPKVIRHNNQHQVDED
jgi:NADH-quinone oxidoreductase subunit C